jgi:hypothetical protein
MDIEQLEALAFSEDRAAALAKLVAGSVEHSYWTAIHLQHAGDLSAVDALLSRWPHKGSDAQAMRQRLERRQLLLRAGVDFGSCAEEIARVSGASLHAQRERAASANSFASELSQDFDVSKEISKRIKQRTSDLSAFNEWADDALIARHMELSPAQRQALVARLTVSGQPELAHLVQVELVENRSTSFGYASVHHTLTLDQLLSLRGTPKVEGNEQYVIAVLARLAPPAHVDTDAPAVLGPWIDAIVEFARTLPPSFNRYRARALLAKIDFERARGRFDRSLLIEYLSLPLLASYSARERAARYASDAIVREQGMLTAHAIPPLSAGEEEIVREACERLLLEDDSAGAELAALLDPQWFGELRARVALCAGRGDAEQWAQPFGPAWVASLRDEVRLQITAQNSLRTRADAAVAVELALKNVPSLTIKVFALDPVAYFLARGRGIDATIDLDGMIAQHERTLCFEHAPIIAHRAAIALPECDAPGVYAVEFIGAGRAARAFIVKGQLRCTTTATVAGTLLYVFDEDGALVSDAQVIMGGRSYRAREDGGVTLPFSEASGPVAVLLQRGSIAQVAHVELARERFELSAVARVEREALVAQKRAKILLHVMLTNAGSLAPLALLEDAQVTINATRLDGVSSSKDERPTLSDERESVLELRVAEELASLSVTVRGTVRLTTGQRVPLEASVSLDVNGINNTSDCGELYLSRSSSGYTLECLGKSGEPRPHLPVTCYLRYRGLNDSRTVALQSNEHGRIALGPLDAIEWLSVAPAGDATRMWTFAPLAVSPAQIHTIEGQRIAIAVDNPRGFERAGLSLFSLAGGAHREDHSAKCRVEDNALVIEGLAPGAYVLRTTPRGAATSIIVAERSARVTHGFATQPGSTIELRAPSAFARSAAIEGDSLLIRVENVTPTTRVHVIATRFIATPALRSSAPALRRRVARAHVPERNAFLSDRQLSDEYRYVIERKHAKRRAGVLLDKPSLLSNPWARGSTDTARELLSEGVTYARAQMAPSAPPPPSARPIAQPRADHSGAEAALRTYDFLAQPAALIANVTVAADGVARLPLEALGPARTARILTVDGQDAHEFEFALPELPSATRDLRLAHALAADAHALELRTVEPAPAQRQIVVDDVRTARLELLDSVAGLWRTFAALEPSSAPSEWTWITQWPGFDEARKHALYSEHACHELHIFLWRRDPDFFARVVRPHLANKRHKTFVDRALLGEDLSRFLEPWALGRLNAIERALLARAHPPARAALTRWMADAVELVPPDPDRDRRLLDTILGASGLEGGAFSDAADELTTIVEEARTRGRGGQSADSGPYQARAEAAMEVDDDEAAEPEEAEEKEADEAVDRDHFSASVGAGGGGALRSKLDLDDRRRATPLFRAPDKTQEWAESNWWRTREEHAGPAKAQPNRLWLDWVRHEDGPFLSAHFAECATSFTEALCAIAVLDVPFVAAAHETQLDDVRYTVTVRSHALAASTRIVEASLDRSSTANPSADPILIGQRYLRDNDRDEYVANVRRDKYVTGPMLVGVPYVCRVVVSNPTSSERELDLLLQIPRGALPVSRGFFTRSTRLWLGAYATESVEYAFYFPREGRFSHFGAHVSAGDQLVAYAEGATIDAVRSIDTSDLTSWDHLSQHGSLDALIEHLRERNLGRVDLGRIAWRMRDREAFDAVISLLESRLHFDERLWAYALVHRDAERARAWLRHQSNFIEPARPALDRAVIELDPIARGWNEHLEYAPLINARAHRVGARTRVLNAGLSAQYQRFIETLAHRAEVSDDDLLSLAHYLFAQDRFDEAIAALDRVRDERVTARVAYDYLRAYARCSLGDLAGARSLATPWVAHPVDRWRDRFVELVAALDEAERGTTVTVADGEKREPRLAASAAAEPSLDLTIEGATAHIQHRNVRECELRLYRMDVELLFSRQPFVQGDIERFSWISPGHSQRVALDGDGRTSVALPGEFARDNLVIEVRAGAARKAIAWYAHDLSVEVTAAFGQLRVLRASTQRPLPATYVKVFARSSDGTVAFFKDGYTDLRGRFDYASVSTNELDSTTRFAILVQSDEAGATVLEAAPPQR